MTGHVDIPSKFLVDTSKPEDLSVFYYRDKNPSEALRKELWNAFIDKVFGESTKQSFYLQKTDSGGYEQVSLYEAMHKAHSWPPKALEEFKDDQFIEGMFASTLKSFFYSDTPTSPDPTEKGDENLDPITRSYINYLKKPDKDGVAKKQNTILLWVWEVLLKVLTNIHESTPTKGNYMLAMTTAEDKAAKELAAIKYTVQKSAGDYATQTKNMNLQTDAEVLRAKRSTTSKIGQGAQSMITQLRDQATQQAQLMQTMMQTLESLYQAIVKK